MKNLVAIHLFILIIGYTVFGQDTGPSQARFNIEGIGPNVLIEPLYTTYFKQNKFIRGWHWGCSKKITEALNGNQAHLVSDDTTLLANNVSIYRNKSGIWASEQSTGDQSYMQAQAIIYEPTIHLPQDYNGENVIRRGNDSFLQSPFGFKTVLGEITQNVYDPNYHRLVLRSDGNYLNKMVLGDVWPDNYLYTYLRKNQTTNSYDGNKWLISINLRRIGNQIASPTDDLLIIQIPIWILGLKYWIIFDKVPKLDMQNNPVFTTRARGIEYTNLKNPLSNPYPHGGSYFSIKNAMVPEINQDITFSASFVLDETPFNYYLKKYRNRPPIERMGIEIIYKGNVDIAIDWVRLETPHANKLFWGEYDDDIIEKVQEDFNLFDDQHLQNRNIKLTRFYTRDEPGLNYWAAMRYFNDLIGHIELPPKNWTMS